MASNKRAQLTGKNGNGHETLPPIELPLVWARNAPHFHPNVKNIRFEGTIFNDGAPVMDKGRIFFRNGYGLEVQRHWGKNIHNHDTVKHYTWRLLAVMYDGRVMDEFAPHMPISISARMDAEFADLYTWTPDNYRKAAGADTMNATLRRVQGMYRHTLGPRPDDFQSTVEAKRRREGKRGPKKQLKFDL